MPRPPKNYCEYFPHDRDMRNHRKIKAIRNKFGITGYAIWNMLLEYLTGIDGNVLENTETEIELMAGDFGVSATEITQVMEFCLRIELLFDKNGFIHSESLNENLSPVYEKRGRSKELSKKQQRLNGKYVVSNAAGNGVSATEIPQIRVDKSIVEKISKSISISEKQEKMKKRQTEFYASLVPMLSEYGKELVRKFYEYWSEPNKSKTKMRFETEKTFELRRRLNTFLNNESRFSPPVRSTSNIASNGDCF